MSFAEQPPSKQWAALKFRGEILAEVWFKPEGEPCALTFRVPEKSFRIPGVGERLTPENLLKAVGIATEEVESWRHNDITHRASDGAERELSLPLPPPAQDDAHTNIFVCMKPTPQAIASADSGQHEISQAKWQDLEARWKAILGLEATIESWRQRMDSLRAEMEAASNKSLTTEQKASALNADVAQWNKAKSRVHHCLPKAREFIHRATWALGTPERKKLDEIVQNHIHPRIPFPELDAVPDLLESLLKDRQVLTAHGVTVYQECKGICAEIQGALRTLQSNAASREQRKRGAANIKGKSFKIT